MQRTFPGEGLNTNFFPIPSVFLTFRADSGSPVVFPSAWVGIISRDPVILIASFREEKAAELPESGSEFAVNLPDEEMTSDYRRGLGSPGSTALRFAGESVTGAPLIMKCPVRIECRLSTLESRFGECYIRGIVAAVHIKDMTFPVKSCEDIFQIDPFGSPGNPFAVGNMTLRGGNEFPGPEIGISTQ